MNRRLGGDYHSTLIRREDMPANHRTGWSRERESGGKLAAGKRPGSREALTQSLSILLTTSSASSWRPDR